MNSSGFFSPKEVVNVSKMKKEKKNRGGNMKKK